MDIKEYLRENGVKFRIATHLPQYTAQEVAAANHVPGRMLAKVVIVRVGPRSVMTVAPASRMVDVGKLKQLLGTEDVRLAEEHEMRQLFPDCELGAEPPFGNLYHLETVIDRQLTLQDEIVFQSGSHRETLRISYADYERLAQPRVAEFTLPAKAHVT